MDLEEYSEDDWSMLNLIPSLIEFDLIIEGTGKEWRTEKIHYADQIVLSNYFSVYFKLL